MSARLRPGENDHPHQKVQNLPGGRFSDDGSQPRGGEESAVTTERDVASRMHLPISPR